ncbi:MAG: hypothetical protein PVJ67_01590 [Candidatus Pacearchaeota archaeon]|jgi:hypothetical protein
MTNEKTKQELAKLLEEKSERHSLQSKLINRTLNRQRGTATLPETLKCSEDGYMRILRATRNLELQRLPMAHFNLLIQQRIFIEHFLILPVMKKQVYSTIYIINLKLMK